MHPHFYFTGLACGLMLFTPLRAPNKTPADRRNSRRFLTEWTVLLGILRLITRSVMAFLSCAIGMKSFFMRRSGRTASVDFEISKWT